MTNSHLVNSEDWLGESNDPLTGFEWKAGTLRVTTGLILWSDVFLYDTPNGEKLAIYLMDTQGLFDHKSSSTDNSRIFSLSTMISSIQILNLHNIIQEDQLQYLQFATEYARYASSDDDKMPFQTLMILIRDWNSPEDYKYGIRGGNAYLNSFLEIHDYQSRELQSVRRYLRSSFNKIDCFLMPHPGRTVARDSSYDGQWSSIDDDFVKSMQDLFPFLFGPKKLSSSQKLINGVPIKPADLLIFINDYVERFKSDEMPETTNIYESTLDRQFRILMGRSVDMYVEAVATHDSELKGDDDIEKLHKTAKEKAMKFFNSEKKFGSYSEGLNYKRELQTKIEEVFQQWKKVSSSHIRLLQQQQHKTEQQVTQVHQAQAYDDKAKQDLAEATKKAEEAKQSLEQARFDTEEARREGQILMERSMQAEKERDEAVANEIETRTWLDKMKRDKEFFEQEYNTYKQQAMNQIENTLGDSQRQSGFSSKKNSFENYLVLNKLYRRPRLARVFLRISCAIRDCTWRTFRMK